MTKACWEKNGKRISGKYEFWQPSGKFKIWLNEKCEITGRTITLEVDGEQPEFNGWRLLAVDVNSLV